MVLLKEFSAANVDVHNVLDSFSRLVCCIFSCSRFCFKHSSSMQPFHIAVDRGRWSVKFSTAATTSDPSVVKWVFMAVLCNNDCALKYKGRSNNSAGSVVALGLVGYRGGRWESQPSNNVSGGEWVLATSEKTKPSLSWFSFLLVKYSFPKSICFRTKAQTKPDINNEKQSNYRFSVCFSIFVIIEFATMIAG